MQERTTGLGLSFADRTPYLHGRNLGNVTHSLDVFVVRLREFVAVQSVKLRHVDGLKDLRASHAGQVNVNFTRQPDVIGQTLKLRAEMERMDFCLSCRDALGTVLYEYLNDTWEELPKIFGLTESH